MKLVRTISELQSLLEAARAAGQEIGLVPTMGALHEGHASLVRRSVAENGVTVVSVFLNPTQFNDKRDLERYPRTLEADCSLLEACGATIAFAPRGESGFGYDPVFYVPELRKTFAQLTAEEKNAISHRGNALRAFAVELKEYLEKN